MDQHAGAALENMERSLDSIDLMMIDVRNSLEASAKQAELANMRALSLTPGMPKELVLAATNRMIELSGLDPEGRYSAK